MWLVLKGFVVGSLLPTDGILSIFCFAKLIFSVVILAYRLFQEVSIHDRSGILHEQIGIILEQRLNTAF